MSTDAQHDPILTTHETAEMLRMTREHVSRLAAARRIRGFQLQKGGDWKFRKSDVEAFIESMMNCRNPATAVDELDTVVREGSRRGRPKTSVAAKLARAAAAAEAPRAH